MLERYIYYKILYGLEQASWSWIICLINKVLWKLRLLKKSCGHNEVSGSNYTNLV